MSLLTETIASGDYRDSLVVIRDRLADAIDDTLRAKHRRECICDCGIGDDRTLVVVAKALVEVLTKLDALPNAERKSRSDELADRRARRLADAANQ